MCVSITAPPVTYGGVLHLFVPEILLVNPHFGLRHELTRLARGGIEYPIDQRAPAMYPVIMVSFCRSFFSWGGGREGFFPSHCVPSHNDF